MEKTKRRIIECPSCHADLSVAVEVSIGEVKIYHNTEADPRPIEYIETLKPNEQEVIHAAKTNGLIKALEEAVQAISALHRPKNIERFFLQIMRSAERRVVPSFILNHYRQELGKNLMFYAANGVMIITSEGVIRAFAPQTMFKERKGLSREGLQVRVLEDEFLSWVRTRYGYAAGRGAMYDNLRKRSIGEFALPII